MFSGIHNQSDELFTFTKVMGSSLKSDTAGTMSSILYSVSGDASVEFSEDGPVVVLDDDKAEADDSAEFFSGLGLLARPLPPEVKNGQKYHAEALCIRHGDRLVPFGYRDTRIKMNGAAPNAGTIALAGYGGGFLSLEPVISNNEVQSTRSVLYLPYSFVAGSPQKAHAIIMDTASGNESVSVIHGDGMAITMFEGKIVAKNKAGTASWQLSDTGTTITGQTNLAGPVVIGNPSTAVPLLAGPASPPSSTLFLSP